VLASIRPRLEIVTVSFEPARRRRSWRRRRRPSTARATIGEARQRPGHFLTGDAPNPPPQAAVGFRYAWKAHHAIRAASGIMVRTQKAALARYLYGASTRQGPALRIVEAYQGKILSPVDRRAALLLSLRSKPPRGS